MDVDTTVKADYHLDVRDVESFHTIANDNHIQGVLADPPYTKGFAANYSVGPDVFPSANTIVKNAFAILPVGGRVGILSMEWPLYPKATARQIAIIGVLVGNGNVGRCFAVYERTSVTRQYSESLDARSNLPMGIASVCGELNFEARSRRAPKSIDFGRCRNPGFTNSLGNGRESRAVPDRNDEKISTLAPQISLVCSV